jgi:hypothetical protein
MEDFVLYVAKGFKCQFFCEKPLVVVELLHGVSKSNTLLWRMCFFLNFGKTQLFFNIINVDNGKHNIVPILDGCITW